MQIQKLLGMYIALIKENVGTDRPSMIKGKTMAEVLKKAFKIIPAEKMSRESTKECTKSLKKIIEENEIPAEELEELTELIENRAIKPLDKDIETKVDKAVNAIKDSIINPIQNNNQIHPRELADDDDLLKCPCKGCKDEILKRKGIERPDNFLKEIIALMMDNEMDIDEKTIKMNELSDRIAKSTEEVNKLSNKLIKQKLGKDIDVSTDAGFEEATKIIDKIIEERKKPNATEKRIMDIVQKKIVDSGIATVKASTIGDEEMLKVFDKEDRGNGKSLGFVIKINSSDPNNPIVEKKEMFEGSALHKEMMRLQSEQAEEGANKLNDDIDDLLSNFK